MDDACLPVEPRFRGPSTANHPDAVLRQETHALRLLKAALRDDIDLESDAEAIAALADGETGLFEAIDLLLLADLEDEGRLEGLAHVKSQLEARAARLSERRRRRRVTLELALVELGARRLERPVATISLAARPPALQVEDESQIPSQFFVARPALDRKALKAALDAGVAVPGATLSVSAHTLTIRRK
jgi:hypothetical protein